MSEDYARSTAAPRQFQIEGKVYQVSKLTPRAIGDIQAFLKDAIPDPRKLIRPLMDGLPDVVQLEMWRGACEAAKSWPPEIGSEESIQALLSVEGQAKFLWVAFRRHTEGWTLEKARELSARYEMSSEEFGELMELMGPKELGDPLAPTATETDSATKS